LPPAVVQILRNGLASGLHQIYLLLAIAAVAAFGVACFFPKGRGEEATLVQTTAPEQRQPEVVATEVEEISR